MGVSILDKLKTAIEKLLTALPTDSARAYQSSDHISDLVEEDLNDSKSGIVNTDKLYRTMRIRQAAINNVANSIGRWVKGRNDLVLMCLSRKNNSRDSDLDSTQQGLVTEREKQKSKINEIFSYDNNYGDKKADYEVSKQRFKKMRTEMGGKPPVRQKIMIYMISISLIGLIEWFINYSTFNIKYPSGIAFGATVIIALSIALASHFHGALLKQRTALFASHRKKEDKRQEIIKQVFFSLLLLIALVIVTYNRYDLLLEQTVNNGGVSLPGMESQDEQAASVWWVLLPFFLMNVLVWVVGVAISYFTHDAQPGYQEAFNHYNKAKEQYHKVEKELQSEIGRIDDEYEKKLNALKNAHSEYVAESKEIDSLLQRLESAEKTMINSAVFDINNMLEQHQIMLVTSLRKLDKVDIQIGPDNLSIEEFQKKDITVSSEYLRKALSMEEIIQW